MIALPAEGKVDQNDFLPRALIRANILRLMGRRDQARSQDEEARQILEQERNLRPGDARVHSALALVFAGLGRADEALREGQGGIDLFPPSKDAVAGPLRIEDMARAAVIAGRFETALDHIDELLSMRCRFSVRTLELGSGLGPAARSAAVSERDRPLDCLPEHRDHCPERPPGADDSGNPISFSEGVALHHQIAVRTRPEAVMHRHLVLAFLMIGTLTAVGTVQAQSLGTFRWQQEPYCNVITLDVVQRGGVYQLTGFDDECDAPARGAVNGTAFQNPDGSIGMGLSVITPSGQSFHLDVTVSLGTLSGTWRSDTNATGVWVFTPGPRHPANARPCPLPRWSSKARASVSPQQ